MAARQLVYLLFLSVVVGLGVLRPDRSYSAVPGRDAAVPQEALRALREGRYLRASQILREYLGAARDTSAAAILLSAQAEAGWGDWAKVEQLLRGRPWLDTLASGHGWELLGRSQLEQGEWSASRASYTRYLAVTDTGSDRALGLALVRRAIAQTKAQAYDSAVANYRKAEEHLPQIGDWLHVFAASAAASGGDTSAVREELGGVDAELARDWGWRSRLRSRQNAHDVRGALLVADGVGRDAQRGATTRAEAQQRAGELRLELRDTAGARVSLLRAVELAPSSAAALAAANLLAPLPLTSAADHRKLGELYLRHGNLTRALRSFDIYLQRGAPTASDRLEIQYRIGRAQFNAGKYDDAERRLLAFAEGTDNAASAATALYLAGRAQYRDGRKAQALATLERLVQRHPTQRAAADAAFLLADLAHDEGKDERARDYYRQATVLSPASDAAGQARMRLAGMAYASGNHAAALQHYQAYLAAFPDGKRAQQATYWAALTLDQLGRDAEAERMLHRVRAMEPFSYYSTRAATRLKDDFWDVPLEPSPAVNATQQSQVKGALARIELLREIGWDDAATFELGRARRHFDEWDGAVYALAEGLSERGYPTNAIAMAHELHRREGAWNLRLLRIVYPFPYRQIILAEAAERKVDPFLAAGLIRQESSFNPRATSGVGAVGLMQVMPQTGRVLAKNLGIKKFTADMLRRPDVNVHLGMHYLADQLRTWNGRTVAVLAAYNAGPTRVERWSRFPEWKRDELFTERIPFDETRDYVKIVQQNAAMYRALYGSVIQTAPGD